MSKATLIEPGVKYFLNETLKNCRNKKQLSETININIVLLFIFTAIIGSVLYYKWKTKPNLEELKQRENLKKHYILNKIKSISDKKLKEKNQIITNLPKFESDFVKLHKNFYNI
jgi:hypothetical protein|tara:strand:- start:179 stop:520 length:342 start_codon:yes stop_codon:yes gene_type:complete